MSQEFDPYFKWLKIPPSEQPPNHYRLLNLARFESDKDVIESAVAQLVTRLQNVSTGDKAEHAQRILNDVAKARLCLSDPERKAEYDKHLKQSLAGSTKKPSTRSSRPGNSLAASQKSAGKTGASANRAANKRKPSVPKKRSGKPKLKKTGSSTGLIIGYGIATLLVAGGALFFLFYTLNQRLVDSTQAVLEASEDQQFEEPTFEADPVDKPQPEPQQTADAKLTQTKIPPPEVEEDIAESIQPPPQTSEPVESDDKPAVASESPVGAVPKTMPVESDKLLPNQLQRFEAQLGEMVEFEGVPVSARASSSGKTRYLHFSSDWDDTIMVYMWTRDVGDDLTVAELQKFVGQTIRVTGVVERQFGTNRLGVKIQAKDQLEVVK